MYRRVSIVLLIALLVCHQAHAFTRTWPSAIAPCNTTLQACVDGSAAADTVLVASNSVIEQTITLNKPFVLRAATGYRPIIGAGFAIAGNVNAAGNWAWQVEGFELQQGFIALSINGGTAANVSIRNNRVLRELSGASEISIVKSSSVTTSLSYDISQNQLAYFWDTFDGALRAAMQILDGGTGNSTGRIRENRVYAAGNVSIGILVNSQDRSHRCEVLGNHVFGGRSGSIYLRQGSLISATSGSLTGMVLNNVIRSIAPGTRQADGIKVDAYDGAVALTALHNTVVDAFNGIDVYADTGVTTSGEINGNLFAYLTSAGLQRSGNASVITDRDNLFFQSSETAATPGLDASSIFADPMLKSVPSDPHLRPGSPAIDRVVGTPLLEQIVNYNLPYTDGDGLRRFKFGNTVSKANILDIGALEAGDETLLYRVPSVTPGNTASIDHPMLNGFTQAAPQQIGNWNPDGISAGIYNDHPVSLRYLSATARWQLRQEDLLNFSAGAAFNVFAPGAGSGRFNHFNGAGNISGASTTMNRTDLNSEPNYILLVTRNPGSGTIDDVASPLAVNYLAGVWRVSRLDGFPMPSSGGFNVYFQEPSANAFRHRATAGNSFGNTTDIDHPLLNGNRCARVHVTHDNTSGISNNHHIGVFYVGAPYNRWSIFNQDQVAMTNNAEFNVVVDAQAVNCADALFASSFE